MNREGRCLIPVFALGRAQELLLILGENTQFGVGVKAGGQSLCLNCVSGALLSGLAQFDGEVFHKLGLCVSLA